MNMQSEAQILLFSDLPDEGELIEKILREVSGAEKVQVESDPKAALDLMANQRFELVFARSAKGALACTDFLNEVWKVNPKSTRFVLADGEPEAEAMVRCALGAHQFIPTPLEPAKVAGALERANAIKRFVRTEKIHTLVSRMRTLPSRPSLYVELMRELRSKNASASTVGELVSKDLAISTKLIQVANSAFFGLEQQVSEPAAAVLQLGLETTTALVLSIEAFARFDKVKPLYFSIDRVWKHSQTVADLARKIAQAMGCDVEMCGQAYTAGLLHDIGKLALAQNFEEDYQRTLKEAETKNLPLYEVEELVFGGTHAETGAYLLAVWGLPLPIVEAVADHHAKAAQLPTPFSATTALHLAEQLTGAPEKIDEILASYPVELGLGPFVEQLRYLVDPNVTLIAKRKPSEEQSPKSRTVAPANPTSVKIAPVRPESFSQVLKGWPPSIYYAAAAFLAIVVVLVFLMLFKGTAPNQPAVTRVEKHPVPAAVPVQAATEKTAPRSDERTSKPELQSTPKVSPLKLQAIMYNGEKSGLIINGVTLHQGDSIEGWRVLAIKQREVVMENRGERQTLILQ